VEKKQMNDSFGEMLTYEEEEEKESVVEVMASE
jgi:hypothetical protein